MNRILKIVGILLGTVIGLATLFLFFWDFSRYQPEIEAAVSNATGREFSIDGNFEVVVLPSPSVLVEGARLANADWSDGPAMVDVGHAYVRVGLWSLLSGPVVVHELVIRDVAVQLEKNAAGESNWDIGGEAEPEEEETDADDDDGEPGLPVDLRSVTVENVTLTYRQPEADDTVFALNALELGVADDDRRQFTANGEFADRPLDLGGSFTARDADIEASFGDIRFSSRLQMPEDSLEFTASVGTLAAVGQFIEVDRLPDGDLSLSGNVGFADGAFQLSNVVAATDGLEVTLNGIVGGAEGAATLSVTAEADSLARLDPQLPVVPASATADLQLGSDAVNIDPFTLNVGDSDIAGSLNVAGGDRPVIRLEATSALIDLSIFGPEEEAEETPADDDASADSADDAPDTAEGQYVFTDEPLPLDTLQKLEANVDLTIDVLKLDSTQFRDFKLDASLADSLLELSNTFAGAHDGTYDNRVVLDASNGEPRLDIDTAVRDLKLGVTAGTGVDPEQIPAINVDLEIAATGTTPRMLAESTDGRLSVTQGPGLIKNDLVEKFSGDIIAQLFSALNPFAEDEEFSTLECSVFGIDFESGEGKITGFLFQSEKLTVVGGGGIDLNTEKLDIEFNTKPRSGVGVSADMFVTPFVKLSGTLAKPSVGLNQKGLLLTGGAAVLTGGMSFLYQGLIDRATAEADRCEAALEAVGMPAEDGTEE